MFLRTLISFIILLTFSFCTKQPSPTNELINSQSYVSKNNISENTTSNLLSHNHLQQKISATKNFEIIHTELHVEPIWESEKLLGSAILTLRPYFYPTNEIQLDAKYFKIDTIILKNTDQIIDYNYDSLKIHINLPKYFNNNDTFSLQINYSVCPSKIDAGSSLAITDERGLYFINANLADTLKPRQLWTQGETSFNSCWFPTIDEPNSKTTQDIFIKVDSGYTVLSNGELIYTNTLENEKVEWYFEMEKPHAPYLTMMAIGNFELVEEYWREKEVQYYLEPAYAPYAKYIFGNTPEMLEFFSNKLNYEYPWNKYAQVVVRDFISGAMENTTASVFKEELMSDPKSLTEKNHDKIIAHELFHHWFGDLVTCESWSNLPLNESFANYAEYLWLEYKYGVDEADFHLENEKLEYLEESKIKNVPIIRYHYDKPEDMFDRHSYNKGGCVLHMLRNQVGDDAFFKSLNLYLNNRAYKTAEINDLRLAFEEITGQDLKWFFDQWFQEVGHPLLEVAYEINKENIKIFVGQKQKLPTTNTLFQVQVAIDIYNNDKVKRHIKTITQQADTIIIAHEGNVDNIVFDANYQILGMTKETKAVSFWQHQYFNCTKAIQRNIALRQLFYNEIQNVNPFDSINLEILQAALNDNYHENRLTALLIIKDFPKEFIENFLPSIEVLAANDIKPSVRAFALEFLFNQNNNAYQNLYQKALEDTTAWEINAAGLYITLQNNQINKDSLIAPFIETNHFDIVSVLADYFIISKDKTQFKWFNLKLDQLQNSNLYYFIGFYGEYIKLLEVNDKAFAKEKLERIVNSNKPSWVKRIAQKYLKDL